MTTHVFSVPGISCDPCKNAIQAVLRVLPGVRVANVDVGTATINVECDGVTVAADELAAAIERRGYRVEAVRDDLD